MSYIFKEQITKLFDEYTLDELFDSTNGHPPILKEYLGEHIDLETVVILEKVFGFCSQFDKKLTDPVWEPVSMKITKYTPFINIDVF